LPDGYALFTGWFDGTLDLGPGIPSGPYLSKGAEDMVLLRIAPP
jgi:hypothetical protein